MKVKVSKNGSEQKEKYLAAYLEEAHGTLMCRGTPVEKHCTTQTFLIGKLKCRWPLLFSVDTLSQTTANYHEYEGGSV